MKQRLMKLMGLTAVSMALIAYVAEAGCGKCGPAEDKCGSDKKEACQGGSCEVQAKAAVDGKAEAAKEGTVSTEALASMIRAKVPMTVVDARSGKWDDGKRIAGAKSLNADSTDAEIASALPDKNGLVVTYCGGLTCPASHKLAEKLVKLGYANVVEYPEGIAGWVTAGNPVTEQKKQ